MEKIDNGVIMPLALCDWRYVKYFYSFPGSAALPGNAF